jgi:phage tail tape-measure protein
MRSSLTLLAIAALVSLANCGNTPQERASGGAAAGAATGAGIGALAGPPGIVVGALIGGGAGAATGAATSPNQLNLGKPLWNNPSVRVPTPNGTTSPRSRDTTSTLNDQSYQDAIQGRSWQQ